MSAPSGADPRGSRPVVLRPPAVLRPPGGPRPPGGRWCDDAGSAVVDFVLVGMLTTLLFASVLQLALALHVRSTLIDSAAEGARYGALADRAPAADGAARTTELIRVSLDPAFAQDVQAGLVVEDGLQLVEVRVTAPLPVLGLLGPSTLTVTGHALREPA